jgi:hypothetical protein
VQDAHQRHKEEQPLHDPAHTHHPPEAFQVLPELAPVVKNQQGSAIPAEQLDLERVNKGGWGGRWWGISTLRPVCNITPYWQFRPRALHVAHKESIQKKDDQQPDN